ncbi:S26 family signal peptidase [Methanocella sp. CWC-04]|uniref:S26 family signal peptidase n=1 Tax=Methanooceanicella nereidis TaxID=2052831 RepID=A0AAP2RDM7_9EURY|nr:S26 family signal peptidase [Methanocella sp. CWC-04]MCD1295388.1 S26 family signal peptidase [Methanocella sp. CWC-04]
MVKIPEPIKGFFTKHPGLYDFLKDLAFSLAVVAVIGAVLYIYAGIWPPMVSVDGISMLPNMDNGDLVFIQGLNRGGVMTYEESLSTGYKAYGDYGDVIVYKPYGDPSMPLVIHRAIKWVNESETYHPGLPPAQGSGYITRGDNNNGVYDQATNICYGEPVREEWILGIARFKIPYLGYLRSMISL